VPVTYSFVLWIFKVKKKENKQDANHSYLCIKAKKYPSLSFLTEAQPRLENRLGQKVLFGRGAHSIFLGDRTNNKTKDIIGTMTNLFCIFFIYLFQIDKFINTY
jgi:hypothetical protein